MSIQDDRNWYLKNRSSMVSTYLNQFVLIKDGQFVGAYPSYGGALSAAVGMFGTTPYFIHQVRDPETQEVYVANGGFLRSGSPFLGQAGVPWGARPVQLGRPGPRRIALGEAQPGSVPELLRSKGALVDIRIGNATLIANQMKIEGKQVPEPKAIVAMIDTGASISAIDSSVAASLGLQQTGSVQVGGVGGMSQQPVFAASLEFTDPKIAYDPLSLSGSSLGAPDFQMLIGRNILCQMILTYDGAQGRFTLARA